MVTAILVPYGKPALRYAEQVAQVMQLYEFDRELRLQVLDAPERADLAIKPRAMTEPEWNAPLLPSNSRLFCVLLMLAVLLNKSGGSLAWRGQCTGLLRRLTASPRWRAAMGLSPRWEEHPLWK